MNEEEAEIVLDPDPHIPYINADSVMMKQVFKNLINNSLESVDGYKPKLSIKTSYDIESNMVKIDFADNGLGIKEENKKKLFVPYFSTKKQGSGLGLAIVHRIIEGHEGYIKVIDNSPRGTIFSIELPALLEEKKTGLII